MVSDGGGGAGRQGARLGGCSGSESQAPVRPLGVMTGLAGVQAGEGAAPIGVEQAERPERDGCGWPWKRMWRSPSPADRRWVWRLEGAGVY